MELNVIAKNSNKEVLNSIISKIKDIINDKNLEPGEKLPSERVLSERFGVSRSIIRLAIQKLELYGLLKSRPQSGTFVADIGAIGRNGMIESILRLKNAEFKSLVETRILLELKTAGLAASRRSDEDLNQIKKALDSYCDKVLKGEEAVEEDLLFHLAIAEASDNSTLNSLMLIIIPEIITNFEKLHVCDGNPSALTIQEHTDIYEAIKNKDASLAKQKMKDHFKMLYNYCYDEKEE
ncbi:FadR/GntR family transcriptional regulator [Formosa sp. PL04]|uniref:FadR/GntR family transcriptional regulator n=1 Tax=Formosa sp. PL04 TaxID=3081755 RepID=UPI0029820CCC|nr:FadR/GntR family transcriptional regulator [Formosa sp. PL04]MDW5288077.1 FadR/GntR family transcriptional regulator [Formosa sp. PL04]